MEAKNKGGAPKGNHNRTKHGLRSALVIGSVPPRMPGVRAAANRFRLALEAAVRDLHGHVGNAHAFHVSNATRAELRYLFAARCHRDAGPEVSLADRMALWSTMAAACEARDKAIRRLGLDADASDGSPGEVDHLALKYGPTAVSGNQNAAGWKPAPDGMHETNSTRGPHEPTDTRPDESQASGAQPPQGRATPPARSRAANPNPKG